MKVTNYYGESILIDTYGEQIVPGKYDYIKVFGEHAILEQYGKQALANEKGLLTDIKYNQIYLEEMTFNRIMVLEGNQWGYIDENGKEVIPLKYKEITKFRKEKNKGITALVTDMTDKTYWIDLNGNRLPD